MCGADLLLGHDHDDHDDDGTDDDELMRRRKTNLLGSYMRWGASTWSTTARLVQRWNRTLHSQHRDDDDAAIDDVDNSGNYTCPDFIQSSVKSNEIQAFPFLTQTTNASTWNNIKGLSPEIDFAGKTIQRSCRTGELLRWRILNQSIFKRADMTGRSQG